MSFIIERKARLQFKSKNDMRYNVSWDCFCAPETIRRRGDEKLKELTQQFKTVPNDLTLTVEWVPHE
jgi:hypothetical protein